MGWDGDPLAALNRKNAQRGSAVGSTGFGGPVAPKFEFKCPPHARAIPPIPLPLIGGADPDAHGPRVSLFQGGSLGFDGAEWLKVWFGTQADVRIVAMPLVGPIGNAGSSFIDIVRGGATLVLSATQSLEVAQRNAGGTNGLPIWGWVTETTAPEVLPDWNHVETFTANAGVSTATPIMPPQGTIETWITSSGGGSLTIRGTVVPFAAGVPTPLGPLTGGAGIVVTSGAGIITGNIRSRVRFP